MNEKLNNYYNKFNEDKRLTHRHGIIEFNTTIKYIDKIFVFSSSEVNKQLSFIGWGAILG